MICFESFLNYLETKLFSTKCIDVGNVYVDGTYARNFYIESFCAKVIYYVKYAYIDNTCTIDTYSIGTCDISICIDYGSVGGTYIKTFYIKDGNLIS